jgi:hypothetical protein
MAWAKVADSFCTITEAAPNPFFRYNGRINTGSFHGSVITRFIKVERKHLKMQILLSMVGNFHGLEDRCNLTNQIQFISRTCILLKHRV